MNKKFMVVALMAALSTIGYAGTMSPEIINQVKDENAKKSLSSANLDITNLEAQVSSNNSAISELKKNVYSKDEANQTFVKKEDLNNDFVSQGEFDQFKDTSIAVDNVIFGKLEKQDEAIKEKANASDVYTKTEVDAELNKKANADDVYTKTEVDTELNKKADADNVYTKTEVDTELNKKADADNVYTKAEVNAELDKNKSSIDEVKTIATQAQNNAAHALIQNSQQDRDIAQNKADIAQNKTDIAQNKADITNLQTTSNNHEARITHLEDRVDRLDEKMNEGLSLMAAMNAVDFQNVEAGEMAIGAGFGHYGNAQSVAVGVAYAPTDNFNVNVKYSATAGNPESFAIGAGASYKFKVGR